MLQNVEDNIDNRRSVYNSHEDIGHRSWPQFNKAGRNTDAMSSRRTAYTSEGKNCRWHAIQSQRFYSSFNLNWRARKKGSFRSHAKAGNQNSSRQGAYRRENKQIWDKKPPNYSKKWTCNRYRRKISKQRRCIVLRGCQIKARSHNNVNLGSVLGGKSEGSSSE